MMHKSQRKTHEAEDVKDQRSISLGADWQDHVPRLDIPCKTYHIQPERMSQRWPVSEWMELESCP